MGCSASVALLEESGKQPKKETATTTDFSVLTITPAERRIVKKNWKKLAADLSGHGAKIFLRIFVLYPHIKQLFPCRDVTGDALIQDPHFRDHSFRFVQAVGAAVDNIDDLDGTLAPLLIALGRQHIHFTGFQKDYFDAFTESIMEIWRQELGDNFTPAAESAWETMFKFMMTKLKEGYQLAMLEKATTKETG